MRSRPDILVLGGGGILGEAWLSGVLAGFEDASGAELARCEHFVGTSAGAIVAARLGAGRALERPGATGPEGEPPSAPARGAWQGELAARLGALALTLGSPLVPAGLALGAPAGAVARAAVLRTAPRATGSLGDLRRRIDETGVRFDGRLRIVAVSRSSGRRVVFGRPGAPAASVGEAVEASCTVPWLFAPVRIGAAEYVDGGVWSPTNLDAAPAGRGTLVVCLNPTAGLSGANPALAAARTLSRSVMAVEAVALRRRGAQVTLVAPDAACAAAIGTDLMDRGRRATVLAAAFRQGLALGGAGEPAEPAAASPSRPAIVRER